MSTGQASQSDVPVKWGFIFPGQGSQAVGMGRYLVENFTEAAHVFEEASDTLKVDFRRLCFYGPEDELQLTENTQPVLLLVSAVTARIAQAQFGLPIHVAAGHSVGEYAAVVNAGALGLNDGLRAVRQRGQAMQEAVAVGEGGMAAILGPSDEQVVGLCQWAQETSKAGILEPANFNCPGQVVVSGHQKVIHWLTENLSKWTELHGVSRVKVIPLKVSAPFHCSLMRPAQDVMARVLDGMKWARPQWPIVQNVTASPETSPETLRINLVRQVSAPVRWTECVRKMHQMGTTHLVEAGSGKVLSGLIKKIEPEHLKVYTTTNFDEFKSLEKWESFQ